MLILDSNAQLGTLIDELYLKPTGMTAEQAAVLCGLDTTEFSAILSGELPMNHKRALALSRGFNTHISFFQSYIPNKSEQ
ncbi:MAG: Uncharacterised protein [Marinobacterium sp. xm-d-530]|nr:MAG: Uncharacterised protein [Marinobacterium sp. xm-d-530]